MLMVHTYLRVFRRYVALIFTPQRFILIALHAVPHARDGDAHGPRERAVR